MSILSHLTVAIVAAAAGSAGTFCVFLGEHAYDGSAAWAVQNPSHFCDTCNYAASTRHDGAYQGSSLIQLPMPVHIKEKILLAKSDHGTPNIMHWDDGWPYCLCGMAAGVTITLIVYEIYGPGKRIDDDVDVHREDPSTTPRGNGVADGAASAPISRCISDSSASPRGKSATEGLESMHLFWPRCGWLVVLLIMQSISSIIMDRYQQVFQADPSLVVFLTMMVGTGGNVGGQSVVLAVRQLALGEEASVLEQLLVGCKLSLILAPVAFVRCVVEASTWTTCYIVSFAVFCIVIISASFGTATPKLLWWARIDPAHATAIIQVSMDIIGALIVCVVGWAVLRQAAVV